MYSNFFSFRKLKIFLHFFIFISLAQASFKVLSAEERVRYYPFAVNEIADFYRERLFYELPKNLVNPIDKDFKPYVIVLGWYAGFAEVKLNGEVVYSEFYESGDKEYIWEYIVDTPGSYVFESINSYVTPVSIITGSCSPHTRAKYIGSQMCEVNNNYSFSFEAIQNTRPVINWDQTRPIVPVESGAFYKMAASVLAEDLTSKFEGRRPDSVVFFFNMKTMIS